MVVCTFLHHRRLWGGLFFVWSACCRYISGSTVSCIVPFLCNTGRICPLFCLKTGVKHAENGIAPPITFHSTNVGHLATPFPGTSTSSETCHHTKKCTAKSEPQELQKQRLMGFRIHGLFGQQGRVDDQGEAGGLQPKTFCWTDISNIWHPLATVMQCQALSRNCRHCCTCYQGHVRVSKPTIPLGSCTEVLRLLGTRLDAQ